MFVFSSMSLIANLMKNSICLGIFSSKSIIQIRGKG